MPTKVDKLAVEHMEAELLNLHLNWINAGRKSNLLAILTRAAENPDKFLEVIRRAAFSHGLEGNIRTSCLLKSTKKKAEDARRRCFGDPTPWGKSPTPAAGRGK